MSATRAERLDVGPRLRLRPNPRMLVAAVIAASAVALALRYGLHDFAQTTLNGLTSGAYFALGAVGLTFVYGSLRLINFAHGDFLTFGAYMAFAANVSMHLPLIVAVVFSIALTAGLGVAGELLMWRPMRRKRAGPFQLILMAVGLAFIVRYGIQFVAGPDLRALHVDTTSTYSLPGGLVYGRTAFLVAVSAYAVLLGIGLMLRSTSLGKQMRALSDNLSLAETTGIDTQRIILVIWAFAGGLAGLAGSLYACAVGSFDPNFGFILLLTLFAAVVVGGIGNPYGALAGGVLLGVVQEWSTLVTSPSWKIVVGFGVLMIVLIVRPQGILGRPRSL
jgi:neutral amino acid transport system permease protein